VTEDEKFLRNMAHEFEEGFNSGDVDRIMRFYADTYVDVNLRNPDRFRPRPSGASIMPRLWRVRGST
jgi:ketosteroid isomerase-like protein